MQLIFSYWLIALSFYSICVQNDFYWYNTAPTAFFCLFFLFTLANSKQQCAEYMITIATSVYCTTNWSSIPSVEIRDSGWHSFRCIYVYKSCTWRLVVHFVPVRIRNGQSLCNGRPVHDSCRYSQFCPTIPKKPVSENRSLSLVQVFISLETTEAKLNWIVHQKSN